jgi:hypothetical protein
VRLAAFCVPPVAAGVRLACCEVGVERLALLWVELVCLVPP